MSLKEFINEKKEKELNHKESTEEAVTILKQAADWLKGNADKPTTENGDAKEIIAKALEGIGTLDTAIVPEEETEVEEEVPEEETEEAPVEEVPAEETPTA